MANYRIDINGAIELSDYTTIEDYINMLGRKDLVNVELNDNSYEDLQIVCSVLEKNQFDILGSNKRNTSQYQVTAKRR